MPLTLLVPDLLPPADAPDAMKGLRLPRIETWLARGDRAREPGTGNAWLLRQWGLDSQASVAALTLAADGGPRDGLWLRADPVHQRIDRNALVLHDSSVLALTPAEGDAAVAALNDFFAGDGLEFCAPCPDRWYVRVPPGELPRTVSLDEAVGRNPFGMIPEGGERLKWPSIFSEAQMLLARLPFNTAREAAGRPTLNAVWFWGGGAFPAALPRPFDDVASSDALARSLALASGCPARPLPAGLAQMPARHSGEFLAVVDSLQAPFRRGDAEEWIAAARVLEESWFPDLGEALAAFGRLRVVLPSERDTVIVDLPPGARWRLFRRTRPLASHA
ncbi:MAG: hypothetical protein IPP91_03830 [Betaproteobacteria bacterium]|nr:hypothetical protein [Betaproteobacteria bacterium]